ncbi:hypothetical protein [Streptomyces olivaceus]|uniref:hypothetical protein n=1 Tax=Streptomyces olivaceus TaxID=47716 RepID=UPI0033ACDCDA
MGTSMKFDVQCRSQGVKWPDVDKVSPAPPDISIGGNPINHPSVASSPAGVQVVTLSGYTAKDVQLNRYYCLRKERTWLDAWKDMWHEVTGDLKAYSRLGNILVVATFGLDSNMPPTDEAISQLRAAGAGDVLMKKWVERCDPGSRAGNPTSWVDHPRAYALVGKFGSEPNDGTEATEADWENPVKLHLSGSFS